MCIIFLFALQQQKYKDVQVAPPDKRDACFPPIPAAPLAPEVREFVVANVTWVTLRLNAWRSGGCPIQSFTVLYKCQSHGDWEPAATGLVPDQVLPQPPQLSIEDLAPATWYQLLVTARNEAGTTEAEYVFATLTLSGG